MSHWLIEQQLRLVGVDVTSKPFGTAATADRELVRRYHLAYEADQHASLLSSVQVEGRCNDSDAANDVLESGSTLGDTDCPRLPPMRFRYSHVVGKLGDGSDSPATLFADDGTSFEAFDERRIPVGVSPPHSLDEQQTTLMDVDTDGLPDVLVTAARDATESWKTESTASPH